MQTICRKVTWKLDYYFLTDDKNDHGLWGWTIFICERTKSWLLPQLTWFDQSRQIVCVLCWRCIQSTTFYVLFFVDLETNRLDLLSTISIVILLVWIYLAFTWRAPLKSRLIETFPNLPRFILTQNKHHIAVTVVITELSGRSKYHH